MPLKLFTRPVQTDLAIIDSQFPQKEPFAFRNAEINEYLARLQGVASYAMPPMSPGKDAWFTHGYGVIRQQFKENKKGYLKYYPKNNAKVRYLDPKKKYKFGLAYSFFLAETYVLLPFLEAQEIPFVFVLYPGGGFGLNNRKSDAMLKRIFSSKQFRGVIVTQQLTKQYLLDKKLCPENFMHYIYGGIVQFRKEDIKPKKYYKKEKKTFDICFVAAKYSEKGVDKGYDVFIDCAKELCKRTDDIMFHVIGGFDENEIDVRDIKSRLKFYGYKRPDFLRDFYADMDILLSPNRPFKLYEGNFDGFPIGNDAQFCGVALFVADPLKMNRYYKDDEDIILISSQAKKTAERIMYYYDNTEALYKLARKGQIKTQRLFSLDHQVEERIKVFRKFVNLEYEKRTA